jgi:X-Pro dipeptidyl-peptidase C-terminal non-catalytic domain/X-Pro dipeptidyl-peptidase (S15 family)
MVRYCVGAGTVGRFRLRPPRFVFVAAIASTAFLAVGGVARAAAGPQPFGHACTTDSAGMRFCPTPAPTTTSDERVRSWDGAPLQADVTLPATGDGPWPTIVMLPGYGGSDGVSWEGSSDAYGSEGPDFNNDWFAERGYAVVTMNFRGVGYSCGPPYAGSATTDAPRTIDEAACRDVTFEFADQRYDARDVQWLLGLLVDEGIAKPSALGVAGESLGSLVTLELALLYNRIRLLDGGFAPWKSPDGIPLHISAAYPIWALSDLLDATAPNGRFLSFEPQTATDDNDPIGAIKLSVPLGLAAEAPEDVWSLPSPSDPSGFNLLSDSVYSELAAPYGPGATALTEEIRDYHQSLGMRIGKGVAPILMEDGWSDELVNGASQALRLIDYLKLSAPRAKVALQLADVGHSLSANKLADLDALDDQATAFFNHYLQHERGGPAPGSVTAYTSTCPASAASAGPYEAPGMAALDPGAVRFSSSTSQLVLSGGDPSIGLQLDPIYGEGDQAGLGGDPQCQTFTATNWPGTAVYTDPVTRTFTMLGLPTMRIHIATIGNYGQLDARLWDVAPDGKETFVSRGTYALTDNQTGTITWQLWGGGYTFQKGDTIRVELLAQDAPIERPSPQPFAVTVSKFTIELPSHEPADGGEIVKPVLDVAK